jgi:hypothetical protein
MPLALPGYARTSSMSLMFIQLGTSIYYVQARKWLALQPHVTPSVSSHQKMHLVTPIQSH